MNRRVHVGPQLKVVGETGDGVALEGELRLRPGQTIDLVLGGRSDVEAVVRSATVLSWAVVQLGTDGTIYRGLCRWQ